MMPAATMTTMTNTAPIAVAQQKNVANGSNASLASQIVADATKMGIMASNKQGKLIDDRPTLPISSPFLALQPCCFDWRRTAGRLLPPLLYLF